jgi:hypothetical protein
VQTRLEGRFSDFWNKKLAVEFSATNAPNPPRLTKTHVCCVFGVSVFDGQNVAKLALEVRFSDFWNKKLAVEFSATNAPNPPRLTQNSCLLRFRSFGFRRTNVANSPWRARFSDFWNKKLAVEFSATNAPNPPRLTQNSCLLRFRSFGFRRNKRRKTRLEGRFSDFWNKKLAVEFSATNAPNPPRLTQELMLLRFRSFGFRRYKRCKLAREVRFSDFWNKKTCS